MSSYTIPVEDKPELCVPFSSVQHRVKEMLEYVPTIIIG